MGKYKGNKGTGFCYQNESVSEIFRLRSQISILLSNSLQVLLDRFVQWWERWSNPKTVVFTINPKYILYLFLLNLSNNVGSNAPFFN